MRRQVTIQDIADRTHVSKTTVSRYLNGKYEFMSEETRQSIAAAIGEMGYRHNRLANSLRTNRSGLIGVVMSNVMSNQTPQLLGSICDTCAEYGIKIIVVNSEKDPEKERSLVYELIEQRVDGLLVLSGYNMDFYQKLNAEELPIVLADRVPAGTGMDSVAINHSESVRLVIDHLLKKGFQRIVILKNPHKNPNNTPAIRVRAAVETCQEYFKDDSHCEIMTIDLGSQDDCHTDKYQELTAFLHKCYDDSFSCPTVIFVAEATIMNAVACCYYRAAISVNDHFSIAGYSQWGMGNMIFPQISMIEQPIRRMGQLATEKLISLIGDRNSELPAVCRTAESNLLSCRVTLT